MSEKIRLSLIFLLCFSTRTLFKLLSGFSNYELFVDAHRYDVLSDRILSGNYDLDIVAYITAPFYCYTLAGIKAIFNGHWESATVIFQFILISISAIYIYRIGRLLFENISIGVIASMIYIFYPLTLWYNFTFTQETTFQAYFIFFCFYFLKFQKHKELKDIILAGLSFSLALLTKSHALMLLPFLFMALLMKKEIKALLVFGSILWLSILPHGILNKKLHNVFTISSHGNASFFLLGHSDQTYECLIKRAGNFDAFSAEGCNPNFVFDKTYEFEGLGYVNQWSPNKRNSQRLKLALKWIQDNPNKFFKLKMHGLQRFILPGLDFKQFKFKYWILSFIMGLFIYIPGYITIFKSVRKEWQDHVLIVSILAVIAAIFIIFFPVNRFRVITLEPLLIVYAASFYFGKIKKWLPQLK